MHVNCSMEFTRALAKYLSIKRKLVTPMNTILLAPCARATVKRLTKG